MRHAAIYESGRIAVRVINHYGDEVLELRLFRLVRKKKTRYPSDTGSLVM